MSVSSLWVHVTPEAALDAFGLVAVPGLAWVVVVTRQILRLERSTVENAVSAGVSPAAADAAFWVVGHPCGDAVGVSRATEVAAESEHERLTAQLVCGGREAGAVDDPTP